MSAGQRDARARAGRLVHLAVDQRGLREHARLLQFAVKVVALARSLADAGEDRDAAVLLGDVVDQLQDRDGLADAGAAEQSDLAAARVRANQVDHLDAGFENFHLGGLVGEGRRVAMDRHLMRRVERRAFIDRLADDVDQAAESFGTDRHRYRAAGIADLHPAHQSLGRVHRDASHGVFAEMLCDLEHEVALVVAERGVGDAQRVEDRGQRAVAKLDVDDVAQNLVDAAGGWFSHNLQFSWLAIFLVNSCIAERAGQTLRASAPPTISISSVVIVAWRARFISSVSRSIMSAALLVALSIAVMRAPCSLASASSSA